MVDHNEIIFHKNKKYVDEQVADVIIIGFGGAGGFAAIAAHDSGAKVLILEKQSEENHYSNTRMSGGGFHSPDPSGNYKALKDYAKAMFSGDNLPWKLEGEEPDTVEELSELWAKYAPENESFMRSLDPEFKPFYSANRKAAFPMFPGAEKSGYLVARSSYTGQDSENYKSKSTRTLPKHQKEAGEAFHACLLNGIKQRNIEVHYATKAISIETDQSGEIIGVIGEKEEGEKAYLIRKALIITSGGYEYNKILRRAFLEGPGVEGWAFYGSTENTGDGIIMSLKVGAGLSKSGKTAARIIAALPVRKHGLKIGMSTGSLGKSHGIVVDNTGKRYASETRINKNPSSYLFYKEATYFDTYNLLYPRIPSWFIFDESLRQAGSLIRISLAEYNNIPWSEDNLDAIKKGWILKAQSIGKLASKIKNHPDNRRLMNNNILIETVQNYNDFCANKKDEDFNREVDTLGPVVKPPFYAMPLYAGGPNTKGGLSVNGKRQVLDWQEKPISRLYSAGEISSAFKFVYQAGGNLAECIVFGRIAGENAAKENPKFY